MELKKQYVRMNSRGREGQMQITLEEDLNLPETKPDIDTICFEKGCVVIEDVKTQGDSLLVKGKLSFCILYHTQENGGFLDRMEGKIPFEEKMKLNGMTTGAEVFVTGCVEDLTVTLINSRKLGIQSVITLEAQSEAILDEELPVGVQAEDERRTGAQVKRVPMEFTQVCLCRKDVFRVREDLTLPAGYQNVGRILWKDASLGEMNFRLGEETLYVQGEVRVFVLYENEGGGREPLTFETIVNVSDRIACSGCREGMTLDVRYGASQWDIVPKPDQDGEQRELGLEMTVELRISVYDQEHLDVIRDVYGVTEEIVEEKRTVGLRNLIRCITGKTKVTGLLPVREDDKMLQVLHGDADVRLSDVKVREGGMAVRGSLSVKALYVTGDDARPYGCLRTVLPFEYGLEIPGMTQGDVPECLQAKAEHLGIAMQGDAEVSVKAILCFSVSVFRERQEEVAGELSEAETDPERMASIPAMTAYVVKPGDDLWSIGKHYYVPVRSIMEDNELSEEEVNPGQKLLIIKGRT